MKILSASITFKLFYAQKEYTIDTHIDTYSYEFSISLLILI